MLENDESSLMIEGDDDGDRIAAFNRQYEDAPATEKETKANKWAMRGRLRSKVLWAAVVGCLITVLSVFDIWSKIGITAEGFREIAASVGAVLTAFGVFNDPTNREGF